MSIITLTTDFGLADSYVGTMKGVILGIAPAARIVDISHQVPPQGIQEAAYVLQGAIPFFPPGTIHVVVVDPGVGSKRRPIAVRTPQAFFVGPDNGVFSCVLARDGDRAPGSTGSAAGEVIHLDNQAYWLQQVSRTFHGRDIFSPVAAHLAAGVPFEVLGTPVNDPVAFTLPRPRRQSDGSIAGQIVYRDHFGNLVSDIPAAWLAGRRWSIQIADQVLPGPDPTYTSVSSGQLVALIGSTGQLEIAVRDGSAAVRLDAGIGEPIELRLHERSG